jgi:hypothetical protein
VGSLLKKIQHLEKGHQGMIEEIRKGFEIENQRRIEQETQKILLRTQIEMNTSD